MSKKHNKDTNLRNKVLVIAACVVALASIAYAAFSTTLNIYGTGNISGNWDVQITGITKDAAASVAATDAVGSPSVASNGLSATFDVDLDYPGAVAYYDLTVENLGTINARLTETPAITEGSANPADIVYTVVTSPALNTQLAPAGTHNYRVKVEWLSTGTVNPTVQSKSATITFKYEQYTP